jgi:hypothetical protein
MAPEQMEGSREIDHRADIYSLGVILYEMLTGELPLGRFALPSQKVQVDVRLDQIVLRALEKEPEHRYQHASELKTDVETITSTGAPPPVAERRPGRRRRRRWRERDHSGLVCAILSVVLFVVGVIVPLLLLALLNPTVAGLTFAATQILASFFGVMGRRYKVGRYTAVGAALVLIVLGGVLAVWFLVFS